MEEEMTSGSCEVSAAPLSASEMSGFIDHPQHQGEGKKEDGSDNPSLSLMGGPGAAETVQESADQHPAGHPRAGDQCSG